MTKANRIGKSGEKGRASWQPDLERGPEHMHINHCPPPRTPLPEVLLTGVPKDENPQGLVYVLVLGSPTRKCGDGEFFLIP